MGPNGRGKSLLLRSVLFAPVLRVVTRLDELHMGIQAYLKGALAFTDIKDPKAILDVGAGSGAWAIQAAQQYPEATVIAADLSPLPTRPLPHNLAYQALDVLQPYPWGANTFDIIHMRLLLFHIPHREIDSILKRTINLLKPNGWLLIEDSGRHTGHENSPGPAQSIVESMFIQMLHAKGLDPLLSEGLSKLLKETGAFSEVNVKCEHLVLSTDQAAIGHDGGTREFSNALRHTIEKIVRCSVGDLESAGLTEQLQKAWICERQDLRFKTFHDFWFFWSCKRAD
ncbi:hypothetical protein C0993_008969 [Termitomyces sp. T159_Od127]|nr:hypothetical protein C0993_008969 [Termitomyces sp. T159_Od127]